MPKYYDWSDVKTSLEEYDFKEHIDSGGFKDVFLAERDQDYVVVKLLPVRRVSRKKRAEREAEAMDSITSPNFVNLIDYYKIDVGGIPTFIIEEEYIDGPTLRQKLDRSENSLDLGIQITDTLLDLLIGFEELSIIHRDIKPPNIMISEDGEIILLDVGIVRFEERESITPDHLDRLGTPNYGAPEQLDYDKNLQSVRTDIFSTGIVLFESITGVHPYSNTGKSISQAILDGDKIGFEGLLDDDDLAEELDTVFEIMTQTEPNVRYRKPEYAKEDFEEIKEMI